MSQSQSNIKNLIKSGRFTNRFNVGSNRENAGDAVLSTISSVGSEEDDAAMTDIEELGEERGQQKNAASAGINTVSGDGSTEKPASSRRILPSIISSLTGTRRSTASRGSRDSSVSRASAVSAGPLPTISEAPPLPEDYPQEASPPYTAPHTPPNQQDVIPTIPPPPNFIPASMLPADQRSLGSTLVPTPPPSTSATPPNPRRPAPYQTKYFPHIDITEKVPPLPTYALSDRPPPSSSGQSTAYTLPRYTPRSSRNTFGSGSTDPQSRFSWHLSNTEKAKGFYTKWFIDWWLFEIICWLFSAVLMAVILGVLSHYNGKPIPQWNVGMTLNAFISVLSGFSRAALLLPVAEALGQLKWIWFNGKKPKRMFDFEILDGASRGPWGSFVFLARSKGITLASIGAAVILLTLPLDLFFQEIVDYPTAWLPVGSAELPRATYFKTTGSQSDFFSSGVFYSDLTSYGTMMSYLIKNPVPVGLTTGCPTGNCTWPRFQTLALCSACADVSSSLEKGCVTASNDWVPWVQPLFQPSNSTNITTCGYHFNPPGLNQPPMLVSGYETLPNNKVGSILLARHIALTDPTSERPIVPGGTLNFKNLQNSFLDFVIANTPGGKDGALNGAQPVAQECALSWCVKTIESTYASGGYQETVFDTQQLNTNDVAEPWTGPPDELTYWPSFSLQQPDATAPGGITTFGTDNATVRSLIISMQDFSSASWAILNNETEQDVEVKYGWQYGIIHSPPAQFKMSYTPWDNANISDVMYGLAQSLTNITRQVALNSTASIANITGTAYDATVIVDLRLQWAALPGGLLLFSLIFLLSTVWRSNDADKVGIWKTSALAMLFNGVGDDIQSQLGTKVKTGDARKRAKDMLVQLDDD